MEYLPPPSAKQVADTFTPQIVDAATAFCRTEFNNADVHAEMLPDCPVRAGNTIREYIVVLRQDFGFVGAVITLKEDGTLASIVCHNV